MAKPTVVQDKKGSSFLQVADMTSAVASAIGEGLTNIFGILKGNWNPSGDNIVQVTEAHLLHLRVRPTDSDYTTTPIGSIAVVQECDSAFTTALFDASLYMKTRDGWKEFRSFKYAEVTLTNAQILALNATPVSIVAAPDTGKIIVPLKAVYQHIYATAAFVLTNVTDIEIRYTGTSGAVMVKMPTTGVLDQTANTTAWGAPQANAIGVANAAAVVHIAGTASPITGAGTAKVKFWYEVVDATNF